MVRRSSLPGIVSASLLFSVPDDQCCNFVTHVSRFHQSGFYCRCRVLTHLLKYSQNDGYSMYYPNGNSQALQAQILLVAQVCTSSTSSATNSAESSFRTTALVSYAGSLPAEFAARRRLPATTTPTLELVPSRVPPSWSGGARGSTACIPAMSVRRLYTCVYERDTAIELSLGYFLVFCRSVFGPGKIISIRTQ